MMGKHLSDEVISRIIFSCLLPIYRKYKWQEKWIYDMVLDESKRKLQFCMGWRKAYLKEKQVRQQNNMCI